MLDPSLSYPAGILSTLAIDTISPLQTVILYTLYHKQTATSTAILKLINSSIPPEAYDFCTTSHPYTSPIINTTHTSTVIPYRPQSTTTFRSQSAISHALSDLLARGYLIYHKGHATYQCSTTGYNYIAHFIRTASAIEKRTHHLQTTIQKMQTVHVETPNTPC